MVKNEEMHYIDSDDQEESVGGKKPDNKWVIKIFFISCSSNLKYDSAYVNNSSLCITYSDI